MRVPQRVIRAAAGVLVAAVIWTAWRTAHPPAAYRAVARIQIAADVVTTMAGELDALRRQVAGTPVAVVRGERTDTVELSVQTGDADAALRTVNDAVDAYLRTRAAERGRRAGALLAEARAAQQAQAAVVDRAEEEREVARTALARAWRVRESDRVHLANVEASLARARARVRELRPVVTQLRAGRSPEALEVVQEMPFVRALQGQLATLDRERAALVLRLGAPHPELERHDDRRRAVAAELRAEVAGLAATLTRDYDAARLEQASLERERDAIVSQSVGPLPSGHEYLSLSRRVDEARASLERIERRQQALEAVVLAPGSGVARVDRAALAKPLVPPPARWPWVLGALAAIAIALAAPPVLRSLGRAAGSG